MTRYALNSALAGLLLAVLPAPAAFAEGPYVDGKKHGRWTVRHADGGVSEGPVVDGKRHGQWTLRFGDGSVWEGPFFDGVKHGQWNLRDADGSTKVREFRHGERIERPATP